MAFSGRSGSDELLAAGLAAGMTVVDAAAGASVSERTAYRRLEDAGFKARVSELRGRMVDAAAGRLADSMVAASEVLKKLLGSRSEKVKLRAAHLIIGLGVKAVELGELARRVEELEQRRADG